MWLPVTLFGFNSIEPLSPWVFCFSNIVCLISTPVFEFISLNVERAGTNELNPSIIEWLNIFSWALINLFVSTSIGCASKKLSLNVSNSSYEWDT